MGRKTTKPAPKKYVLTSKYTDLILTSATPSDPTLVFLGMSEVISM